MTVRPIIPPREELNIGPRTAELLALIDAVDDGDSLADALEAALLALTDISGDDPNRPTIAQPSKLARRVIARVTEILEVAPASE